jgi:hypothetical protein
MFFQSVDGQEKSLFQSHQTFFITDKIAREPLLKGLSSVDLLVFSSLDLHCKHICDKRRYLNEEVNCIQPFPSVSGLAGRDESGAFTIKTENSLGIQNALAYLADVE